MHVFKVAVLGADSGGEIAEAIAAAGIEVLTADFGDADFAIEVVPEEEKGAALAALDAATPGHAVLATTTVEQSVTELAQHTIRPHQVVGFHAVGPRLVEIVAGDDTSPEAVQQAVAFAQQIRKQAIRCADVPGFVDARVAERGLRAACEVIEEEVAGAREVELATGLLRKADEQGLDSALAELGDEAPVLLRRLVAQGRLGRASGQGFFPYPNVEGDAPVKLERRGETAIAWLDSPPANSLSPATLQALSDVWQQAQDARVLVIASANPHLFCAGADIKAFAQMDAGQARELARSAHELFRSFERSSIVTIAAVNALALGGGCELAMACDVRIAAASASFGQPEINLGIVPGFGGTQRLPRLVGANKALEMNVGAQAVDAETAWEFGLVNRVVPDHELLDEALRWARTLARRAPLAIEQIKRVSGAGDLDDGIAAEIDAFARVFASEDGQEGIAAFLGKREARFRGR